MYTYSAGLFSALLLTSTIGVVSVGCEADDGGADTESQSTDPGSDVAYLTAENNYAYESQLHIPSVETGVGGDVEICWEAVTRDFQCHDIDPLSDIDNVTLVRIRNLDETEIETALSGAGLEQANIDGFIGHQTDGARSCVRLSEFTFLGSAVDIDEEYTVSPDQTYLLILNTGLTPGVGSRMMTFMTPSDASTNLRVDVQQGCDVLDFDANLTELTPLVVSVSGETVMDWSDLAPPGIDRVMLGYYEGMTRSDLAARVLDLMQIATKKWSLDLERSGTVRLNTLVDDDGNTFPGFDGEGTWIFALLCGTCQNPAPPFLTVLTPKKGGKV